MLMRCDVKLNLPQPKRYPTTSLIPFSLKFTAPASPWVSQLMAQNLRVDLVRYITILIDSKRSTRETVLGRGEIWRIEEQEEGVYIVYGNLKNGKTGAEYSWRVPGMVNVRVGLDGFSSRFYIDLYTSSMLCGSLRNTMPTPLFLFSRNSAMKKLLALQLTWLNSTIIS